MSRGFLIGLLWGLVVATAGLAVMSLVAPPVGVDPAKSGAMAAAKGAAVKPAPEPVEAAGADEPKADVTADPMSTVKPAVEAAAEAATAPVEPAAEAALTAAVAPAETVVAQAPVVDAASGAAMVPSPEGGDAGQAPVTDAAPQLPAADPTSPEMPASDPAPVPDEGTMPAPKQDKLLDPPAAPVAPTAEAAPMVPADGAGADQGSALPQIPVQPDVPSEPEQAAQPDVPVEGAKVTLGDGSTLVPDTGLDGQVVGVVTNRLPRVGDAKAAEPTAKDLVLQTQAGLPIAAFARAFSPEAGKPKFAILLRDIGAAGMARDEAARLPFAVTFVIDPAAPDAAEAARVYRAAGQEVMILLASPPEGATAGDLEQSLQALAQELPETVAMLDAAVGGLQENRVLATQAIPILQAQGRGIVTFDKGLGAVDQVAAREGLAHASIFRDVDRAGEGAPAIRRYLDRAAFKAAQEGQVVVIGQTRPETVAAILEWMVEGRGSSVQLAPITAVMAAE